MSPKIIQKYLVNREIIAPTAKKSKLQSFFEIAKKHIISKGTKKENLALNTNKIL